MEQACKDLGVTYAFETAPDPTSDVGQAGAQQFILEKVPAWVDKYGKKAAFFCTNDAHTEPLLKQLLAYGGMFVEADLPSPLMGYPGALGIDLSKEAGNFPAILKKVEQAVVDKGGKGTHDKVMRAARLLQAAGAEFNILCTVHKLNGDRGKEVYRFFRDEVGASFMQFIPIIERATPELIDIAEAGWGDNVEGRPLYTQSGSLVTGRSIGPQQYGDFLVDIFEEWVRRDVGSIYVQMFDVTLANFVGAPPSLCIHSETCGRGPALEHNGDLYTCDHFVEPRYKLGNINQTHMLDLVASPRMQQFGLDKRDQLPRFCRECDVRFACHGGCPKDRFREDPYGEPGHNYLCAGFKSFFGHVGQPMRAMEALLKAGRPAAEIMYAYAAEDAARGRNDACSCGSGRKFKRCHGDRPLLSRAAIDRAVAQVMTR
jgi:uncharacterized protein